MKNKIFCEPCLDTLAKMPDKSIDCVITSPPYWQLRDYNYPEQWGLEPTFEEYLEHLWQMMDEIYRVLKPEGTVWINLGDTYGGGVAGKGGDTGYHIKDNPLIKGTKFDIGHKKPLNKSLLLIPHRFAIGCIDRGWKMRNDIIWAKRNAMPESVTDRFSKKHEYMFFMVKSDKYYFNLDAIKDKIDIASIKRELRGNSKNNKYANDSHLPDKVHANTMSKARGYVGYSDIDKYIETKNGKNPGDVSDFWDIPTKSSSDKHYATYNVSLIAKPILAGCPENGIIYDPFAGTGTTCIASLRSGRNFIASEAGREYYEIAVKNIEPYLLQKTIFQ